MVFSMGVVRLLPTSQSRVRHLFVPTVLFAVGKCFTVLILNLRLWFIPRFAITRLPARPAGCQPVVTACCQNISLYEPEQSLSLSQDEGEQC